jgi:hypothetical protein
VDQVVSRTVLCGRQVLDVARFPEIRLVAIGFDEADDGWNAPASVVVRDVTAPIALRIRPLDVTADGRRRVEAHGVLDLRTTPIRVPRAVVGRYVEVHVEPVPRAREDDG